MDRWAGKVAVITGASAGIGLATAQAFVREGLIVVGLARRKSKMEQAMKGISGPGKFYAKQCDVSKEKDVNDIFKWVKDTLGTVHILINNAGVIRECSIADSKIEDLQFVINVNLMGLLYCSKEAMNLMKANGQEGHIININSVAGQKTVAIPEKYFNVYSASKFAVRSLSETLSHELLGHKIRVCNISPGLVKTEIFNAGNIDDAFLKEAPILESEDVTASILHVISAPPHVQITELTIRPTGEAFL